MKPRNLVGFRGVFYGIVFSVSEKYRTLKNLQTLLGTCDEVVLRFLIQ